MLMSPDDGGIDDQIFEVRIIGHRLEDAIPDALDAPSAEAPEYTVPIAKRFGKITPRRACAYNPKHALHEHPIIASSGTLLVRPTYDQRRYPLPRSVAQNQPIHHTQDCLPKAALNLIMLLKGNPMSPHNLGGRISSQRVRYGSAGQKVMQRDPRFLSCDQYVVQPTDHRPAPSSHRRRPRRRPWRPDWLCNRR